MKIKPLFFLIFITLFTPFAASSAVEKNVQLVGQWPLNYSAKNMAVDNNRQYLYLGNGDHLVVLNKNLILISNSAITSSGQIDGIFFSSEYNYIFAACKSDGLRIIDVSDVENPIEIGTYSYPNESVEIVCVYVDNQRAFLACGSSGVLILDISDPSMPSLLQEVELPGAWVVYSYAVDIYVDGDYAWVADLLNGIRIINVKDIDNPKLTNILLPNVRDLEISDAFMYAATEGNGLDIIDISDPEKAERVSKFLTSGYAEASKVDGNFAYVAYAFGSAGIRILDVTDKTNLNADKRWAYTESDAKSVNLFPGDTSIYITSEKAGMKKIDCSDKTNMHSVASFDMPADAVAIDVSGSYIYAVDNNVGDAPEQEGLRIHQISSPNPESIKASLTGFCATPGEASDIFILSGYAYVADGNQGLQIIDIKDKVQPKIISNVSVPGFSNGVYVNSNYAYMSVGNQGIAIIDVNDAANPSLVSSFKTPGTANDLFIAGDYAYVADGNQGLQIIDIKDKAQPKIIGTKDMNGIANGIYVENNYAYMAAGNQGLVIISLTDKSNPAIISSYNTPGSAEKISVSGSYAYIADGDKGVCVINITDRTHPVKENDWSYDTEKGHAGNALDVFSGYSDDGENLYAFIADGSSGVVAVHLIAEEDNNNNGESGGGGSGCFIHSLFN